MDQGANLPDEGRPMEELKQILTANLLKKGVAAESLAGFLKTLAKILAAEPEIDAAAANARLRYLGWPEVEVDYHLLQIALACFESESGDGIPAFTGGDNRARRLRLREIQPETPAAAEI